MAFFMLKYILYASTDNAGFHSGNLLTRLIDLFNFVLDIWVQ